MSRSPTLFFFGRFFFFFSMYVWRRAAPRKRGIAGAARDSLSTAADRVQDGGSRSPRGLSAGEQSCGGGSHGRGARARGPRFPEGQGEVVGAAMHLFSHGMFKVMVAVAVVGLPASEVLEYHLPIPQLYELICNMYMNRACCNVYLA